MATVILSRTGDYALRAVLAIAQSPGGTALRSSDLARQLRVPHNYLTKILHALARDHVLISARGRRGGFRLAVPASELSLDRVLAGFGSGDTPPACLLGQPKCSDDKPCGAHLRWRAIHDRVQAFFGETTVADLLSRPPRAGDEA